MGTKKSENGNDSNKNKNNARKMFMFRTAWLSILRKIEQAQKCWCCFFHTRYNKTNIWYKIALDVLVSRHISHSVVPNHASPPKKASKCLPGIYP